MPTRRGVTSTSEAGKGKKGIRPRKGIGWTNEYKSIKILIAWEFRDHFHVPLGIAIRLMGGSHVSTEEESFNAIFFHQGVV